MASTNSTSSFTAVNDEFSHLDLNGKIIIKAEYGNVIRKIPITNDEITFDELILMMQRLFKLQPTDEIEIKYRDEDNDLVSIVDGNDLTFAIQCSRVLKLKIFVNTKVANISLNEIRDELLAIRNRCINSMDSTIRQLDKFGQNVNGDGSDAKESEPESGDKTDRKVQKVYSDPPRELDPVPKSSPVATLEAENMSIKSGQDVPKNDVSLGGDRIQSNNAETQPVAQHQPVLQQAYPSAPRPPAPSQFGGPPQMQDKFQGPPPPFSQGGFNQNLNDPSVGRPPSSTGMPPSPAFSTGTGFSSGSPRPPQAAKQFMPPTFAPVSVAGPYQPPTSGPMPPPPSQFGPPTSAPQGMQSPPFGNFPPPGPPGSMPPMGQHQPGMGGPPPPSSHDHNLPQPGMNHPPQMSGPPMPPGQARNPHHQMPPPGAMPPQQQMFPQGGPPGGFPPQGPPPPQGMPGGMPPQGPPPPPQGMQQQGPPRQVGPPPMGPPPTNMPGNPGANPYMMPQRMRYIPGNPYMPPGEGGQ